MLARSFPYSREQEDPLSLLTARVPVEYKKGALIYSQLRQPGHLHVVVRGRVMVTRGSPGRGVVIEVYGPNEFFGECALTDVHRLPEEAVALERTDIMRWTKSEVEELVLNRPQLAVALMQALARRTVDFGARLENCLGEKTGRRVLRSLIRFSERSAARDASGAAYLPPLTHRLLSRYVGTTREIVTQHMNDFRRRGLLDYSRKGITLTARAFEVASAAPPSVV